MSIFLMLARPALMLIFLVAGVAKLRDPAGLRQTYAGLGVPRQLRTPSVVGLPLAELAVVGLLAWPATAVSGALLASVLALLFLAAVVFVLATGRSAPCSCFGKLGRGALGRETLVRDLVLLGLAAVTLAAFLADARVRQWSDPVRWSQLSVAAWLAVCFAGTTLLVSAYAGWMITALVRQNARLLRRPAGEPAGDHDVADLVRIGSPAPSLEVIPGEQPAIPGVQPAVLAGFTTLLIFVDDACHTCVGMAPDIASWQAELAAAGEEAAGRAQILVVAQVRLADGRVSPFAAVSALDDIDGRVTGRYEVTATPVAMVVDEQERFASRKAFGPDEIRHLHRHFLERVIPSAAVEIGAARGLEVLR